jgi:hypothetical protein
MFRIRIHLLWIRIQLDLTTIYVQATEEGFSPQREHPAIQNMKFLNFFLLCGSFLPPPGYGFTGLIEFGPIRIRISNTPI